MWAGCGFVALTGVICQPNPTPHVPLYEFQLDFLSFFERIFNWICGFDKFHLSTQPIPHMPLCEVQLLSIFYRIFNLLSVSIGSDRCQLSTQPNPPCAFMWVSIGFLRFFLKWFSIESLVFTSSICHLNPTPLCLNMSFNWIFGNYQLNLWIWQMSFVNPTLGYFMNFN